MDTRPAMRAPSFLNSQAPESAENVASPLTSALLAAFVVFVLGGVVLGAYWFFIVRDGAPGNTTQQSDFDIVVYRAEAAVKRGDWGEAYRYATTAHELKPDPFTKAYLADIKAKMEELASDIDGARAFLEEGDQDAASRFH